MSRAELLRLGRFGIVGATNTAITLATFTLLVAAGAPAPAAAAAGFALGAVNGYRLNRRWTFGVAPGGAAMLGRYVAVQAVGAALSAAGVAVATGSLDLSRLPAEVVVVPAVTVVTYVLVRRLVFRPVA